MFLRTISAAPKKIPGMERDKSARLFFSVFFAHLTVDLIYNVTEGEKVTEIFFQQVLHY